MSKLRNVCLGILLMALALGLSGCFGSSALNPGNESPTVPDRTIVDAELPYVPKALTGEDVGRETIKSLPLPTDNDGWGDFEVVPQIGTNYNSWVDGLRGPLTVMLNMGPEDTIFNNRENEWAVAYEQSRDPEYDVKLTFTLPSTGELMAVLRRKDDGSKYDYVARRWYSRGDQTIKELRQLKFEYNGYENHATALVYRKDTPSNMNDIMEIWENADYKKIKCLRVYSIDTPEPFALNFAAVVDISDAENRTTGIIYVEGIENEQSPAVFNDNQQLVAIGLTEEELRTDYVTYPGRSIVDSVYNIGVTLSVVEGARINQATLESNF